eukprot:RCo026974
MPDDRDFVQKLKKKASKKEKAEKYGQPYKQKWLQANERFLGSDRLDAALKEQDSWEKDFSAKRKLEAEPFAESSQKKKSKAVEHVATVEEARRNRLYAQVIADGLKAYVSLKTSKGDLNFEIFCSKAPRAAENFLGLCQKGYYNGVTFHRLVPGLMVQGGDPTGTGRGGESLWSGPFPSEIAEDLSHNRAGVLSMANAGKDLNKSQLYAILGLFSCAVLTTSLFLVFLFSFEALCGIKLW